MVFEKIRQYEKKLYSTIKAIEEVAEQTPKGLEIAYGLIEKLMEQGLSIKGLSSEETKLLNKAKNLID